MSQEKLDHHQAVQEYYGKTLQGTKDLQTSACCTNARPPAYLQEILKQIHPEVTKHYYGCGLVAPQSLAGLRVLDLGSGSGRDCFVLSKLVGPQGRVVGVDMTPEQLAIGRQHLDFHQQAFGFSKPNVEFVEGDIERLQELGFAPGSFDLIISNCVVNLANDKAKVFAGAQYLLAEGGEMYFSDVYADRRIPQELAKDPLLYGECLSGALYWNDFIDMVKAAGFGDPRIVNQQRIEINNEAMAEKLGAIQFHSVTIRLFKLSGLESNCEDYGQALRYLGDLDQSPRVFELDAGHRFETGRLERVCGNSFRMIKETRFAKHFDFYGDFTRHFGQYPGCGGGLPFTDDQAATACC